MPKKNIRDDTKYIFEQSKSKVIAKDWSISLYNEIYKLDTMPKRFAIVAETKEISQELRQFMHHSHRVIYGVDDNKMLVTIYHVRHGARTAFASRDLQ